MRSVLRKPRHGRKSGRFYRIGQSTDVFRRHANTNTSAEDIARQLDDALHRGRTASQHDPSAELPRVTGTSDVALHEIEDLIHALMDDVREQLAWNLTI